MNAKGVGRDICPSSDGAGGAIRRDGWAPIFCRPGLLVSFFVQELVSSGFSSRRNRRRVHKVGITLGWARMACELALIVEGSSS